MHLYTEVSNFNTNPMWYECFVLEYSANVAEDLKWFSVDVYNSVRLH